VPSQTGNFSPFAPKAHGTTSKPAFDFLTAKLKTEETKPALRSLFAPSSDLSQGISAAAPLQGTPQQEIHKEDGDLGVIEDSQTRLG
jgi:hypothetical protein